MRSTNAGLNTVLTATNRFAADLYTFYFREGTYRWTAASSDLTDGVNTWLSTGPVITRNRSRTTAGLETDTLELVIHPGSTTLASVNMRVAALQGSFDNVRVIIQRAMMTTWGSIPLPITLFDGVVTEARPYSTEILVTVKSGVAQLVQPLPRRLIQPQCSYRLFDTGCGLSAATYTSTLITAAGSTASVINISSTSTNAVAGGFLKLISGTMNGLARSIRSVVGTTITLTSPFPAAPATSTLIEVVKGCDKTRTTCATFSNIARFGGFPDTPKPEAT